MIVEGIDDFEVVLMKIGEEVMDFEMLEIGSECEGGGYPADTHAT